MAEHSFFYDSVNGDEREYSQEQMSMAFKHAAASNGVSHLDYPDPLLVVKQPNGDIIINPGIMVIQGFFYYLDSPQALSVPGYLQGQIRSDYVVIRLDTSVDKREAHAMILEGINSSSSQPATIRDGNTYDMCIAQLSWNGIIMNVIDRRTDQEVCGFVGQQYATSEQGIIAETVKMDLETLKSDMGIAGDATKISIQHGGTNADTAEDARQNLGITPGNIGAINKQGDTMAGSLLLYGDPTDAMEAAPKQYVDEYVNGAISSDMPGNAATATRLQSARTISTSEGATGTPTTFDGSGNISIPITALNMNHATAGKLSIQNGGTNGTTQDEACANIGASRVRILTGASDCNQYTIAGQYVGANWSNRPTGATDNQGTLIVEPYNAGWIRQTFNTPHAPVSWVRSQVNNAWSQWEVCVGAGLNAYLLGGQPASYYLDYITQSNSRISTIEGKMSYGTWTPSLMACGTMMSNYEFRFGYWYRIYQTLTVSFGVRIANASTQITNTTGSNQLHGFPYAFSPGAFTATVFNGYSWDSTVGAKGSVILYHYEAVNACHMGYSNGAALTKTEWVANPMIYGTFTYRF